MAPWDDHGTTSLVQSRSISSNLPVILCAPHGGNAVDGNQADIMLERQDFNMPGIYNGVSNTSRSSINVVADVGTSQLVEEIDRRVTRKMGEARGFDGNFVGAVVARFHRKFVDANRPLEDESAVAVHPGCARAGGAVHDKYHRMIDAAVRLCLSHHREAGVLLIDVHGQKRFVNKVIVGTRDGQTANLDRLNTPGEGFLWHLRRTLDNNNSDDTKARSKTADIEHNKTWAGADAGAGAGSTLDSASIVVLPPPGHDEITGYNGGYTVKRHGTAERVDAVQLEFGRSFRGTAEGREMTAEAVASAICFYLQPLVWFFEEKDRWHQRHRYKNNSNNDDHDDHDGPDNYNNIAPFLKNPPNDPGLSVPMNAANHTMLRASSRKTPPVFCEEDITTVQEQLTPILGAKDLSTNTCSEDDPSRVGEEHARNISETCNQHSGGWAESYQQFSDDRSPERADDYEHNSISRSDHDHRDIVDMLRRLGLTTGRKLAEALRETEGRARVNAQLASGKQRTLSEVEAIEIVQVYDELMGSGLR